VPVDRRWKFYKGRDPRDLPAYTTPEAAHYLKLPVATLRSWVLGREYPTASGKRFFKPVIRPGQPGTGLLSFFALVEAHVLAAIRRQHGVRLDKVRIALAYLTRHFPSQHPLADHRFETNGLDLFVEKYGKLINVSQSGQLALRALLERHLRRIDRDSSGLPIKLYPFTTITAVEQPRAVVIDPRVSFGRPVLAGTGVPTSTIFDRYKAGESIEQLADDYGLKPLEIQEAIRCEAA